MTSAQRTTGLPAIDSAETAEQFCGRFLATIEALRAVVETETRLLREMDIAGAEAVQAEKSRLAEAYLRDMSHAKAQAGRLAELAPEALEAVRRQHDALRTSLMANEDVLGALKSASQSLIRAAAERVAERSKPSTYAPAGRTAKSAGAAAVALDRQA